MIKNLYVRGAEAFCESTNFKITGYDPSPGSLPSPPLTFIYPLKYPEGFSVHSGIDVRAGSPGPDI